MMVARSLDQIEMARHGGNNFLCFKYIEWPDSNLIEISNYNEAS
jgi:hypothetical protein